MNKKLFEYIQNSPTAYHACESAAKELIAAGFCRVFEGDNWTLEQGKGYFVTRNGSSLIAFRVPRGDFKGFMITAAHGDSPCLKIKENSEIADANYTKLSVETYGGTIFSSWFDRPLAIAGRVAVKGERGIELRLINSHKPCAIIPNVAIHMNREINRGYSYNAAVDLLPLFDNDKQSFSALVATLANANEENIVAKDLYLYNPQPCVELGKYISAPRLDDLQCAFASLTAFLQAKEGNSMPVYALFDNEEVGSTTKQGAASTFMADVIGRIIESVSGTEKAALLANSLMLSCDNAHAVHPNHPEYADKNHSVYMNKGVVIKHNANQKYTTDAVSAALLKLICAEAGVPVQEYANRADMAGGSTLGNISNTQVSLNTVDIGLAQIAMHSSYETAGSRDTQYMVDTLTCFFSKTLRETEEGYELV